MAIDMRAFNIISATSDRMSLREILEAYEAAKVSDQPDEASSAVDYAMIRFTVAYKLVKYGVPPGDVTELSKTICMGIRPFLSEPKRELSEKEALDVMAAGYSVHKDDHDHWKCLRNAYLALSRAAKINRIEDQEGK